MLDPTGAFLPNAKAPSQDDIPMLLWLHWLGLNLGPKSVESWFSLWFPFGRGEKGTLQNHPPRGDFFVGHSFMSSKAAGLQESVSQRGGLFLMVWENQKKPEQATTQFQASQCFGITQKHSNLWVASICWNQSCK